MKIPPIVKDVLVVRSALGCCSVYATSWAKEVALPSPKLTKLPEDIAIFLSVGVVLKKVVCSSDNVCGQQMVLRVGSGRVQSKGHVVYVVRLHVKPLLS
jgi:hypothetical protein